MATGSYISVITLNVNGLNAPTKRQRLAEWIQKQDPYLCCLQETHLKTGDTYRLKVKGWKKIFHANRDQKKAGVAILISDKIDYKTKAVKRDKEGHYIMIKGSILEKVPCALEKVLICLFSHPLFQSLFYLMWVWLLLLSFGPHLHEISFFQPFTFSLYVSLVLRWVSCRQHRGLVFVSIQPVFVFWLGYSTHLHLR